MKYWLGSSHLACRARYCAEQLRQGSCQRGCLQPCECVQPCSLSCSMQQGGYHRRLLHHAALCGAQRSSAVWQGQEVLTDSACCTATACL